MRAILVPLLVLVATAPALAAAPLPLRAPDVDFTWTPPVPGEAVTFTSLSTDDVLILLEEWAFDGSTFPLGAAGHEAEHTFPFPGVYPVALRATDNTLMRTTLTRSVVVPNRAPIAEGEASPSPARRGEEVVLRSTSYDPDGEGIAATRWSVDGVEKEGVEVTHVFGTLGQHDITLEATDVRGATASLVLRVRVLNAPPVVDATYSPAAPRAGAPVVFSATGIDPDAPGARLAYEWRFADGTAAGATVERAFVAGDHAVSVRAFDEEGAASAPLVLRVHVAPAEG